MARESEEALHAFQVEGGGPAVERPLRRARLFGALGQGVAEEHQGTDELVVPLLGPGAQQLDLLPLVGMLDAALAPSPAHAPPCRGVAGTEGCHTPLLAASRCRMPEQHPFSAVPIPAIRRGFMARSVQSFTRRCASDTCICASLTSIER